MTEWPGDLLGRADGSRPLPRGFRDRLEEVLTSAERSSETTAGAFAGERSDRLEAALADPGAGSVIDPVGTALGNIDGPRPLRPATNRTLERAFARRSGRRRLAVLSAVAAVLVLAAGLTVAALSGSSRPSSGANNQALTPPSSSPATNGTAASGAAPAPAPAAAPGGASSPASQSLHAAAPAGPEAVSTPAVVAISPPSGPTAGGTEATITGRGMEAAASVDFGKAAARFRIVSATQLQAVAPAHAAGVVAVTVSTAGGDVVPGDLHFTYH